MVYIISIYFIIQGVLSFIGCQFLKSHLRQVGEKVKVIGFYCLIITLFQCTIVTLILMWGAFVGVGLVEKGLIIFN